MKVKKYAVYLNHDSGKETIIVPATSKASAIKIVMEAEGCPRRAIRKVMIVKERKT